MDRWGADRRFIAVCKALHEHTEVMVRVHDGESAPYQMERGLREGCPSSPPLFNCYHTAVMTDYEIRGNQGGWESNPAERRKVDDERGRDEEFKRICIGSVCFAYDTATIAMCDEAVQADEVLRETMTDWEEKNNESKRETLRIEPGGRCTNDVRGRGENAQVSHVGAWLQKAARNKVDAAKRSITASGTIARIC